MKFSKYKNDTKRWDFKNFLLQTKTQSTAMGYLSSLNSTSLVNVIAKQNYGVEDIFRINDIQILSDILVIVLKDQRNRLAHNRFSSALKYYILYINTLNE